jgi:hypothetical protein
MSTEPYKGLDPTTPFRGTESADAIANPAYKTDPFYRSTVEAKFALDLTPAPSNTGHRLVGGRASVSAEGIADHTPFLGARIMFGERDFEDAGKIRVLTAELHDLEQQLDDTEASRYAAPIHQDGPPVPLPAPRAFRTPAEQSRLINSPAYRAATPYGDRYRHFVAARIALTEETSAQDAGGNVRSGSAVQFKSDTD